MIIRCKVDVTKVEKARLFAGKNGAKYLDITLLENKNGVDQYGNDGMIVQDVSKAEREAGTKGPILGNFKIVGQKSPPARQERPAVGNVPAEDDSVPF